LSAPLRGDIERARETREVHAAFVDGLPVAFAYVSLETERHGDLSVDTQEGWQRRGFGAAVLRPVIAGLVARGVRPVWAPWKQRGLPRPARRSVHRARGTLRPRHAASPDTNAAEREA
jgi:hypothetical protein